MSVNRSNKSKVVKTGIFSFLGAFVTTLINVVSGLIIAPALGSSSYGLFVLTRDLCNTFAIFTKFGLDLGVVRFIAENKSDLRTVKNIIRSSLYVVLFLSFVFICIVWFGGASWLELNFYKHENFALVFSLLAISVPLLSIMKLFGGVFRGLLDIKTKIIGELIMQPLTRLMFVLFFFVFSVSVWSVVWGTILSFLCVVIYFLWKAKEFLICESKNEWFDYIKKKSLIKYAFTVSLTMSVALLLQKTDTLMLGYFKNLEDVGRYAIVQLSVPFIGIVNGAFSQRLAPEIARLVQVGDIDQLRATMKSHVYWMTVSSAPLFFIFVFFGKDMLKIFGSDYAVGLNIIIVLASAQFMQATLSSIGFVLSMTSKYSAELPLLFTALIINFVLNYSFIPQYGLLGAASATLIALSIGNILRIYVVYKIQKVWVLNFRLFFPLISAFISMCSLTLLRDLFADTSVIGSFVAAAFGMIFYMIFMYNFGLKNNEKIVIFNLLKNRNIGQP